ncbi:MAG TPA: D-alanyl-D-alanine carboxypeptidase [Acidimicrobiales bacterium]|nr:D-alanyl-D-alanine carboxypeptidase [Acidimicrobiales bacterium]
MPRLGDVGRKLGLRAGTAFAGAAVVGAGLTGAGPHRTVVRPAAGGDRTPVLSVRRVPGWIETSAVDKQLTAKLPKVMAGLSKAAKSSCLVVRNGGQTAYAYRPLEPVTPASNMKILTAIAVAAKLGTSTRITTRVVAAGPVVHGVLHGNLYLVGGGDPVLRASSYVPSLGDREPAITSLPQLAGKVKKAGITAIDGRVLGDGSLFDNQRRVSTWSLDYDPDDDVGPLGALDVNDGFLPTKPFAASSDPADMTAGVFARLLRAAGVKVGKGRFGTGTAPRSAHPVTSIQSPTVGDLLAEILRVSDDTGTELLTKLLGARFGGAGTTAAGTRVVRQELAHLGLPVGQLRNLDGSGLDTGDRVTCNLVADALQEYGTHGPVFAGLPVAGRSGTLAGRMEGTVAAGRVHAKTGTLNTVAALSGWVMPAAGAKGATPIIFSLITNGPGAEWLGVEAGNTVGVDLATPPKGIPPRSAALPLGT